MLGVGGARRARRRRCRAPCPRRAPAPGARRRTSARRSASRMRAHVAPVDLHPARASGPRSAAAAPRAVLLPEPLSPTSARVRPAGSVRSTPESTGWLAVGEADAAQAPPRARRRAARPARAPGARRGIEDLEDAPGRRPGPGAGAGPCGDSDLSGWYSSISAARKESSVSPVSVPRAMAWPAKAMAAATPSTASHLHHRASRRRAAGTRCAAAAGSRPAPGRSARARASSRREGLDHADVGDRLAHPPGEAAERVLAAVETRLEGARVAGQRPGALRGTAGDGGQEQPPSSQAQTPSSARTSGCPGRSSRRRR